jgi:mannose-binding lectin
MSSATASGKQGIEIGNYLPEQSVICVWSAFTQTIGNINIRITDSNGNPVVDQSGTGTGATVLGSGNFTTDPNGNTVYITCNGGGNVTVLYSNTTLTYKGNVISESLVFAGEDGSDNDFNDVCLTITWFSKQG